MDKSESRQTPFAVWTRSVAPLGPALARVVVGMAFVATGWGKVHGLDDVTKFFEELGIPLAHANAVLVANVELFGGALLVLGLATRLAAAPLLVTMVVAIATAKLPGMESWIDLFGFEEMTYLAVFAWLVVAGPGAWSLDHWLAQRWRVKYDQRPAWVAGAHKAS